MHLGPCAVTRPPRCCWGRAEDGGILICGGISCPHSRFAPLLSGAQRGWPGMAGPWLRGWKGRSGWKGWNRGFCSLEEFGLLVLLAKQNFIWLFSSGWSGRSSSTKGTLEEVRRWRARPAERPGMGWFCHRQTAFQGKLFPWSTSGQLWKDLMAELTQKMGLAEESQTDGKGC